MKAKLILIRPHQPADKIAGLTLGGLAGRTWAALFSSS